jgi:predicted PurR-regulated permease PerM
MRQNRPQMKPFSSTTVTTTSDRLTTVLSYGALLLLGYVVFLIFEPFLVPLTWSAVLAIFFYPVHERLARRMRPSRAALISTLGVTLLLIVPTLVVLAYTAKQAIDATASLQAALMNPERELPAEVVARVRAQLPEEWQSTDFSEPLRQGAEKIATFLAGEFGALVKNLVSFFVALFILVFALFFMFRDGEGVVRGIKHLFPFDRSIQEEMLAESKELIFASVAVGLLVAGIQGTLGGTAFAIARIHSPIFWGVVLAFFSLVPVVGSAMIWLPTALWLGFSGHWGKAIVIMAICGGVAGTVDNIIRPLLLRNRTQLNELLLFIGVLGGLSVFGLLGLVVGPAIVAAAMAVFRVHMLHREDVAAARMSPGASI